MTNPSRVEHSPLPWVFGMTKLGDAGVYDSNNKCVCVIVDENKADTETAAFIVEACNAYEANQKALQVAVEMLTEMQQISYFDDAEGPELRAQNANLHSLASNALKRIREIQEAKP